MLEIPYGYALTNNEIAFFVFLGIIGGIWITLVIDVLKKNKRRIKNR